MSTCHEECAPKRFVRPRSVAHSDLAPFGAAGGSKGLFVRQRGDRLESLATPPSRPQTSRRPGPVARRRGPGVDVGSAGGRERRRLPAAVCHDGPSAGQRGRAAVARCYGRQPVEAERCPVGLGVVPWFAETGGRAAGRRLVGIVGPIASYGGRGRRGLRWRTLG